MRTFPLLFVIPSFRYEQHRMQSGGAFPPICRVSPWYSNFFGCYLFLNTYSNNRPVGSSGFFHTCGFSRAQWLEVREGEWNISSRLSACQGRQGLHWHPRIQAPVRSIELCEGTTEDALKRRMSEILNRWCAFSQTFCKMSMQAVAVKMSLSKVMLQNIMNIWKWRLIMEPVFPPVGANTSFSRANAGFSAVFLLNATITVGETQACLLAWFFFSLKVH